MTARTRPRSPLVISVFCLAAAVALPLWWFTSAAPAPANYPLPGPDPVGADSLLVRRTRAEWGDSADRAARDHGERGLLVLDRFGDEAVYCLEHDAAAFAALLQLFDLDAPRFRLATGYWKRAVLDWAQNGRLGLFVERLRALGARQLVLAEQIPAALPLLCDAPPPEAVRALERHGNRAWALLRLVDHARHRPDLIRVAAALQREGDRLLSCYEQDGLPLALLSIPGADAGTSGDLARLVRHVLGKIEDRQLALALLLVNGPDLRALIDAGRPEEELNQAVNLFAELPSGVQELAADHTHTLRLLAETWQNRRLGDEVLRRCGPHAADTVYHSFADDERRRPALVALAHLGPPALEVLNRYRSYGPFQRFLRRCRDKDLLRPGDNPPLVVTAFWNIAQNGQGKVDTYAEVDNLAGQVLRDSRGPAPEAQVLAWIPGYTAVRTAIDSREGYQVTGGDVLWASVDAIGSATFVYGAVSSVARSVSRKVVEQTTTALGKQAVEKSLTLAGSRLAGAAAREARVAAGRLGKDAGQALLRRPQAFSGEFARATQSQQKRLAERIGIDGAEAYAKQAGYQPLFRGKPGQGRGLVDLLYKDGDQFVVLEAKCVKAGDPIRLGLRRTAEGRTARQGSLEYTDDVLKEMTRRKDLTAAERQAAADALKALKEGRLRTELVWTEHRQGVPALTRAEVKAGGVFRPGAELRPALLNTPGLARAVAAEVRSPASCSTVGRLLAQGRAVAKLVRLHLWEEDATALATRTLKRKGEDAILTVLDCALDDELDVDALSRALMERLL